MTTPSDDELAHGTTYQTFTVTGMTCGHCEKAVTRVLHLADPRAAVRIDRAQNRVDIDSRLPRDLLAAAIRDEGYGVAA